MNDKIEAAILKLKAEVSSVVFTGFVANAQIEPPAMLTGEVWGHVCADGFGNFGDGHRIQTSDIVQIYVVGDSVWLTTRSGSDYGILSFTSMGWAYLAYLHQAHCRLDPLPPGSPIVHLSSPHVEIPGLAKKRADRQKSEAAPLSRKDLKRELLGPVEDKKYMDQMEAYAQKTIETLQRNGVRIANQEA